MDFPARFVLVALLAAAHGTGRAHEVPSDATVQMLVKPSGGRLQVLVRAPLGAIRDVEFPQRDGGYLDVERLAPRLPDTAMLWFGNAVVIHENGARLPPPRVTGTQISLESDRSFASFDEAVRHVTGPKPPNSANLFWKQVWIDVLLEYPIQSSHSAFSIRPGVERLAARVVTAMRFYPPDGTVRAYQFTGDPGLVPLDPRWSEAAKRFVELGFRHILDGADHLLFLVCLVIPVRRLRPLVLVVTAFTAAHSLTLIASAFDFAPDALWFPPLIETLIAASIVFMALENIVTGGSARHRWMIAFGFGLVHGFGFSFGLRETLQFAGSHMLTSLLSFNVGVELGQIAVLCVLVPAIGLLFRYAVNERMGTIILSALVAHSGWHWLVERTAVLLKFDFDWSAPDSAGLARALRWLMWCAIGAGALWAGRRALIALAGRWERKRGGERSRL